MEPVVHDGAGEEVDAHESENNPFECRVGEDVGQAEHDGAQHYRDSSDDRKAPVARSEILQGSAASAVDNRLYVVGAVVKPGFLPLFFQIVFHI